MQRKSAGFIDLVQVPDEIKDGLSLGSNFMIYSSDQTWLMEFVGGQFIFNTRKLFNDAGVINQNCVVEADGRITSLDRSISILTTGLQKQSICDERVKSFVYNNLNNDNIRRLLRTCTTNTQRDHVLLHVR